MVCLSKCRDQETFLTCILDLEWSESWLPWVSIVLLSFDGFDGLTGVSVLGSNVFKEGSMKAVSKEKYSAKD